MLMPNVLNIAAKVNVVENILLPTHIQSTNELHQIDPCRLEIILSKNIVNIGNVWITPCIPMVRTYTWTYCGKAIQ